MRHKAPAAERRVIAGANPVSEPEMASVLTIYAAIEETPVRQAVLDVLVAIREGKGSSSTVDADGRA